MSSSQTELVLDTFATRLSSFSQRTSEIAEQQIDQYKRLQDQGEGHYLRESLVRLYLSFLDFARGKVDRADESFVAQTRQRAYEGVPLESILKVWRIANHEFWKELLEVVELHNLPESVAIDLWGTYLRFYDTTVQASEKAYDDARSAKLGLEQLSAARTLDTLLTADDKASTDYMLSSLGVTGSDIVVLASLIPREHSRRADIYRAFIPVLSTITTRSGVRPPWTTHDGTFIAVAERQLLAKRLKAREDELRDSDPGLVIGISNSYAESGLLSACLDQALKALHFANSRRPVVFFDELTPLEGVAVSSNLSLADLPEWVQIFTREDEAHDFSWSQTVDALMRNGGNVAKASRDLFIHANTVYYRISTIKSACGVDLTHPEVLAAAHLASLLSKIDRDNS